MKYYLGVFKFGAKRTHSVFQKFFFTTSTIRFFTDSQLTFSSKTSGISVQ
jgi:hypothetical protein